MTGGGVIIIGGSVAGGSAAAGGTGTVIVGGGLGVAGGSAAAGGTGTVVVTCGRVVGGGAAGSVTIVGGSIIAVGRCSLGIGYVIGSYTTGPLIQWILGPTPWQPPRLPKPIRTPEERWPDLSKPAPWDGHLEFRLRLEIPI